MVPSVEEISALPKLKLQRPPRSCCDELRRANLPCVAYVRDDNSASRAVFGRLGFERVGDVRWCMVRLGGQRL